MVREATHEDIPVLVDMMQEFYEESAFELDRTNATLAFRTLLDQPSYGAIWLSHDEQIVTGYVVLTVAFKMEFAGLVGSIDDLYIRSQSRRKGFANELMQSLMIDCYDRSLEELNVEVATDNLAAQTLYANFGLQLRTDNRAHLSMLLKSEF